MKRFSKTKTFEDLILPFFEYFWKIREAIFAVTFFVYLYFIDLS